MTALSVHIVTNSSPIILLSRLGLLSLLDRLYERVTVPKAVFHEVVELGADLPGSSDLAGAGWVEVVDHEPNPLLFRALGGELGAGEAAALTLAIDLQADFVLIDERQGRRAARRLGLAVKGTLGVLISAKRQGEISALRPRLDELVQGGAWITPALRRAALAEVGEEEE